MHEQGIKSFLHAQIKDKNGVKLFVGLDDCQRTRVWNEKEINSLMYAAKMISIFLLQEEKKREEKEQKRRKIVVEVKTVRERQEEILAREEGAV